MHTSHLLLGRPWQYDRKVKHDGFQNHYSFIMEGKSITLVPLSPRQAYEDQLKINREARKNCENKSSKEFVEKESEKNMSGKEKEEVEHKKIYFATNDINSSFPSVNVSLMQEFEDEFPKTIKKQKGKDSRMNLFEEWGNNEI